jgi:hypothetical protein
MSSLDHATAARSAPASVVAPNVWIRKARRTGTFAVLAYVNAAAWVAISVDVASKSQFTSHLGSFVVMLVFLLGVAALSVITGLRLASCGLWMSQEKIVIVGPLRTWTLGVGEVEGFEPGVRGARNGTPCPVLKRTHGRPIGVWALGREGLISSYDRFLDELRPLCEELNELLGTLDAVPNTPAG